MTPADVPVHVRERYHDIALSGHRITRWEETSMGSFRLCGETAWQLGTNNLGLFVGATTNLYLLIEILKALELSNSSPTWIVIAASMKMAEIIFERWIAAPTLRRVVSITLQLPQTRGNIILATPESLKKIPAGAASNVAALILVDMLCHVHLARQMPNSDRPQLIADFRNQLCADGWAPPLIIVTQKPAKSVSTSNVARAYCLEGLWFIDGKTFRIERQAIGAKESQDEDARHL